MAGNELHARAALPRATDEWSGLPVAERIERAANRIRTEWSTATNAIVSIGQVVVDACYGGVEAEALAPEADGNELYALLVRRLGTLKGGPNEKTLSIARRVAAATKQVRGHFWDVIPYGYKAQLIRLPEPSLMADGAKVAVEGGLTERGLAQWVDGQLALLGRKQQQRGKTLRSTRTALDHLSAAGSAASARRIGREYGRLDDKGRRSVRAEVARARAALEQLEEALDRADAERSDAEE